MEPEGSFPHSQVPILSQLDPFHIPKSQFLKIHLNIILPSTPGSLKLSFPQVSPTKTLYTSLLSSIRAACPANLLLLDFIIRKIFGEQYRSLSSSLCSFLQSPVTSSLLDPNVLLSTLLSNMRLRYNFCYFFVLKCRPKMQ